MSPSQPPAVKSVDLLPHPLPALSSLQYNSVHTTYRVLPHLFLINLLLPPPTPKVYRKHRVADISGGVGAYLEPEAAAAQIASGKKVDYESDDGFGDALVTRQVDVEAQVPKAPLAGDGVKKEEPDGAGSAAAKAEPEAAADVALKEEPHASENGDPSVAEAKSKAKEEPCSPTIDVQAPSPLVKEDEDEEDIDVDVDPSDSMHAPEQKQLEMEQGQRAQVERRLAEGLNVHKGQGIAGTNGGEDGSGHRPLRDGEPGVPDGYDGEDDGSGLGAHDAGGPTAGVGRGAPGRPRGRPKRSSFEGSERGPSVALSSVSEEDEVDWDDSADEDMDAATAEAMEQARIDMARAAARDLRESRATRWVYDVWGGREDWAFGKEVNNPVPLFCTGRGVGCGGTQAFLRGENKEASLFCSDTLEL